ncbi:MAG: iron-containing alcohol dehydrogenase [Ottowia sp.]|uniref:iron-containing alcohol dehydrogenase n=1 Tax=Ottowia sp. TaxID=1898956 RepID=UPI003C76AA7E
MINNILTPRRLVVGGGSIEQLPQVLAQLGIKRPLLVADPNLVRLGLSTRVESVLRDAGVSYTLFTDVVEDPTDACVNAASAAIVEGDHDGVIGFGGGSAIDTAKAAAVVATLRQPIRSLMVPRIVDEAAMPVVAIPTTAGTGSEVTRACVVTDSASHEKMLILGMSCLPAAAVVDFEFTLSCPFRVTADTGLDALTHALEALVNRNRNPHADAFALSALRLIGAHLETACFEPANRAAREAMMLGATHAGLAVSNTSTALVHGMSRPIGAFFHVPHGLSNAMLLAAVTEFSAPAAPAPYAAAARALGWAQESDAETDAVAALIAGFHRLNSVLKVPTPAAFGIDKTRYFELRTTMATQALQSGTPPNNPRLATEQDIEAIYAAAWVD